MLHRGGGRATNGGDAVQAFSCILINLLKRTSPQPDACVPARIGMITKHPHYGLAVCYRVGEDVVEKTCTKALALVVASNASQSNNMNEGYQMITEGVKRDANMKGGNENFNGIW